MTGSDGSVYYSDDHYKTFKKVEQTPRRMNRKLLYESSPPWVLIHLLTEEDKKWLPAVLFKESGFSPAIRILRGQKMRNRQSLMDEFGAALQFSEPFGENWYALKDCLSYLHEWMSGDAFILTVIRPQEVLIEEPDELQWLLLTIREAGEWWSHPITDNGIYNRNSVPFHLVLQCDQKELEEVRRRFGDISLL